MTLILAASTVLLAVIGFGLTFTSVKAHWQVSRRCTRCQYDLHTHSPGDHCPECGFIIGEFADGFIERRPARFGLGVALLMLAVLTFAMFTASIVGYRIGP